MAAPKRYNLHPQDTAQKSARRPIFRTYIHALLQTGHTAGNSPSELMCSVQPHSLRRMHHYNTKPE